MLAAKQDAERMVSRIPLRRTDQPEEVAEIVASLASQAAYATVAGRSTSSMAVCHFESP